MRNVIAPTLLACAGLLFTGEALAVAGGATTGSSGSGVRFTVGSNTTFSWSRMDLNAARKAGKPILLYIYDSAIKNNNTARSFEMNIFPDKAAKEALQGFTYVMIRPDDRGWPLELLARAKEGAACYILLCDGTVVGTWWKGNVPNAATMAQVAMAAAQGNQAAVDRMAKAPPAKFEQQKPQEVAAVGGPAAQPAEKEPEKVGAIPGLGNEEKGKDKAADAGKKKEPEKIKLEDE